MTKADKDTSTHSSYRVLARKYRPRSFDDLIGQEPMVRTLSNAFETGRIAQAYMLTGVRGVGKTTTARILARALNFKTAEIDQPSIDLKEIGENCQSIMDGNHLDVIEMDAASHTGIDDIRDLIESAQYKPTSARYKVYIIDEVHMLSRNAFNGLLKTLEEPPEHLKFIFATTEIRKVPVTVLSRCQRFDLRRITSDLMTSHLSSIAGKENVEIDAGAVAMIVRASEGSVRDALSLMDQAIAHCAGAISAGQDNEDATITIKAESVRAMLGLADRGRIIDLFEHLMKGDVAACLEELGSQYQVGAEPAVVLADLADFIHFVTRLKYVPGAAEDPAISEAESKKGSQFASDLSVRVLGRAWQILLKGIEEVKSSERPLMAAEMVLVRLAHAAILPTPDEIIRSIENSKNVGRDPANASAMPGGGPSASTGSSQGQSAIGSPGGSSNAGQNGGEGFSQPTANHTSRPTGQMTGTNGPHLSIVTAMPQSEPVSEETPQITLHQFEELIFLAEDKRDLQIKNGLRRHVRLVNFEDGRMEFSIAGAPRANFIGDLQLRLKAWTGKRWNLIISREPGAPSIEEVEQAEEQQKFDSASADPAVEAVLARFPGSKIIDVRIREDETPQVDADDILADDILADEIDDGLDDFFE